jgi:hypothetical protein
MYLSNKWLYLILYSLTLNYDSFSASIIQSLRKDPEFYTTESIFASLINESKNKLLKAIALPIKTSKPWKKQKGKHCTKCKMTSVTGLSRMVLQGLL